MQLEDRFVVKLLFRYPPVTPEAKNFDVFLWRQSLADAFPGQQKRNFILDFVLDLAQIKRINFHPNKLCLTNGF